MQNKGRETETLKMLTSYWTERAHSYSEQNIEEMNDWRREAWRELILANAPKKERLRVLDVGTGPGFFAMNLALAGHEVTAVDVTEHMIYHAASNAKAYGAQVNFILHRGEFLPFEDSSFDLVVSRNVLWNLEYPEQALSEWTRVLAPGGRMVYFDANWYLYLFDEKLREKRETLRSEFRERHPELEGRTWDLGPKRAAELERTALSLPLSRQRRPEWDRRILEGLGLRMVRIAERIGMAVQDPVELERDEPTPLFMVCAEKQPSPEEETPITQESINQEWTVRSDNYNNYVVEEFATDRPEKWLELIEANAPAGRPLRVLDAGCGPGFFSVLLSRAGHDVTGIDGSEGMLAHAVENAARFGVSPELIRGDFGELPFANGTFDLVISRNVTHIIREHLKVYGEWLRVLKPGGVLLIFDANWHLPYQPGPVREEAIRREREGLEKYGRGFTHDGSYEYIDSGYEPENYRVFGKAQRPDFDMGVLRQLPCTDISFDRDVTEELWSEKEKQFYGATPLYMLRAVKRKV